MRHHRNPDSKCHRRLCRRNGRAYGVALCLQGENRRNSGSLIKLASIPTRLVIVFQNSWRQSESATIGVYIEGDTT